MVMSDLKKTFRPEFLNRVDEIIVFHKLTRADTRRIAQKLLGTVNRRMERAGVELRVPDAALDALSATGYDPVYGARPLAPGDPEHDRRSGGGDAARRLAPARRCGHGAGAGRKNCFDENVRTWYDNALNVIWTEAYPNMAQNMQTENKAVYLDRFVIMNSRASIPTTTSSSPRSATAPALSRSSSCRRVSTRSAWRTAG